MKKIAIIDINDLKYNELEMVHSNFTREKINDLLLDYITLKDVSNEDEMMQVVIDEVVGENNDYPIHTATTKNIYHDLYLTCHISPSKEMYEEFKSKSIKFNGIASYFSDIGLKIYGKAVLFKLDTKNDAYKLLSITMDEIVDIFISKFVHKGVILNLDGSIDEFNFIFNPVDWISPNEINKYKFYETEILGKVLMLFFDTTSTVINDTGNIIYPSIKGKVIIGMRDQYSDMNDISVKYEDLDIDTFKKIIKLCSDSTQTRNLTDEENTDGQFVNGKRRYNNFYKILNNRCFV